MCNEALDVVSYTRSFEFIGEPVGYDVYPHKRFLRLQPKDQDPASHKNALVFREGSIRHLNLSVQEAKLDFGAISFDCTSVLNEDMEAWLEVVKACSGTNLHLSMLWNRWWHHDRYGPRSVQDTVTWQYREDYLFDYLDATWHGAFRKVEIELGYSLKCGNGVERMTELAEACACRLLHTDAGAPKLSWGDEVDREPQYRRNARFSKILCGERKN
jgi:hypothetical protein